MVEEKNKHPEWFWEWLWGGSGRDGGGRHG